MSQTPSAASSVDAPNGAGEYEALLQERALRISAEAAAKLAQAELAAERLAIAHLNELTARLFTSTGMQPLLDEVLAATIALQSADFGCVQLYDPAARALLIAAQHGFERDFLDHFRECRDESTACGRALLLRQRVIVEDVRTDLHFAPHSSVVDAAGYRAVQSTPLFTRSGEPLGIISIYFCEPHRPLDRELRFTDLYARVAAERIERHRAEKAMLKLQTELAHVARAATLGELAASIAHEVNQPLAAVITNGHACLRWLAQKPLDLGEAAAATARIVRDAKRASEVIARTRAFLQRGTRQVAPIDINEAISEMIAMVQAEIRSREVSSHIAPAEHLPPVVADRIQLQQVILNLVMNALDAMSSITDRARTLQIAVHRHDMNALRVAVSDSGIGLDDAQRERVFDAFYTSKPHGIGLGLAISRSIVEAHGGSLWVTRNDSHGETFHFTLPIAAA